MYIHSQNIYKTVINFAYKKICLVEQFLGVPLLSWPLALAAPHVSTEDSKPEPVIHCFIFSDLDNAKDNLPNWVCRNCMEKYS